MPYPLFEELNTKLESFLSIWLEHMRDAGYLEYSTAKRLDCIDSFHGVLKTIQHMAPQAGIPDFALLLKKVETEGSCMIQTAKNHRLRGIKEGMFLGAFKTLIHSLEDIILAFDVDVADKLEMILKIRRVCDALETAFISDGEKSSTHDVIARLQDVNRQLTLKKNRYENIFRSTSDLVILTDFEGRTLEVNPETERHLSSKRLHGKPFWEFLCLDCQNMEQVLSQLPVDRPHEITSKDNRYVFNLRIVPLSRVSLATPEYMLILSDISFLVDHRQELEHRVAERTAALSLSQDLLRREKAQTDEMNVTLRNVMKSIESDRNDLEQKISLKIRSNLLPALDKVRNEPAAGIRASFLDLIQEQLISLTSGFDTELDASMLKLSKTELRICSFIKAGCSSKEIAEVMNLAFDTIRTHRKNIRRKLGLHGTDINLYAYLANRNCTLPEQV